jgi:predicted DNA-binding transcriptional regulator YafY
VRRADRLYRITDYLRGRRLTTAQWLADRLDVCVRTIYRDLADLGRAGVPITGEAGVGYALARRIDLPPLMFDLEELEALAVGLRFAQASGDAALVRAAERAQAKIRSAVPRDRAEQMARTPAFVTKRAARESARLREVLAAVQQRRVMSLAYVDVAGAESQRAVWPLGVLFAGAAWSMIAWCELRNDFRAFRLDRLQRFEPTDRRYPVQPGRRLEDYFAEMEASHGIPTSDFDPEA